MRQWTRAVLAGVLLACPLWVRAQPANNGAASVQPGAKTVGAAPEPVAADTAGEEHLLGDWGGARIGLEALGIDLQFGDTNEFKGDVSGGAKRSATNAGQATFQADVDWGKLAGLTGFATHMAVVGRYGADESALLGDQLSPVQEIYGSGGNVVAHLVYLYAEQTLLGGRLTAAAGRIPVGNDFAASPLYCAFMNNIVCGNPKALVGNIGGFTAWPDATWGGRVRYRPTDQTYVQVGVYEVSQAVYTNMDGFRSGWQFDAAADSGVEVPVELSWQPAIGADRLAGHYKLGAAYDSSRYAAFNQQSDFLPAGATGPQRTSHGRMQYWALADQMLVRNGPGAADGLILLGGYIHNDPSTFVRSDQVFGALEDHGFWPARPKDTIGLLVAYTRVSGSLRREELQDVSLDLPLPNAATGVQTDQLLIELDYDIHLMEGVDFMPDAQYMVRPNAQQNIPNATILGFKSKLSF